MTRPSSKNNIMTLGEHEVDYVWVSNFYGVEIDPNVDFQLSQRADHIVKTISSRVRFNRAIINPKWDSYYSYSNLHRLHILFGESNMSEYACWLKVGTTSLVLDLIEEGTIPTDIELADPLETLRSVSRDPEMKWTVRLRGGKTISAIDLQRRYLDAAKKYFRRRDEQTDAVLARMGADARRFGARSAVNSGSARLVCEICAVSAVYQENGLTWQDDVMQSLDLEYHNVSPRDGLFYGLEAAGAMQRMTTDAEVERGDHDAAAKYTGFGARADRVAVDQ